MHNYHANLKIGDKVWVQFEATYAGENALGEPIVAWNEAKTPDENKPRSSMIPTFASITNEVIKQG